MNKSGQPATKADTGGQRPSKSEGKSEGKKGSDKKSTPKNSPAKKTQASKPSH